jgi:hypothetical protein
VAYYGLVTLKEWLVIYTLLMLFIAKGTRFVIRRQAGKSGGLCGFLHLLRIELDFCQVAASSTCVSDTW